MLSRLNGLALLAGAMALASICAVSAHAAGDSAAGDPSVGEKKFYTCVGCHGIDDYKNAYPDYSVPRLRHQNSGYIISALQEYKSGERPHATMHAQASSLSDEDMQDIAAYLQGTEPVKPSAKIVGSVPPQVAPCTACHGGNPAPQKTGDDRAEIERVKRAREALVGIAGVTLAWWGGGVR